MTLSEELQIALNVALAEAGRRRHEFAEVEHLLYALHFLFRSWIIACLPLRLPEY